MGGHGERFQPDAARGGSGLWPHPRSSGEEIRLIKIQCGLKRNRMGRFKIALVDLDGETVPDWVSERLVKEGVDLVVQDCRNQEELAKYAGDADVVWLFG